MKHCEQYLPVLQDYLDRELAEGEAQQVAAHLGDCAACADRTEALRDLKGLVRERVRSGPAPAGLCAQVLREVRKGAGTHSRHRRFGWRALGAAAALVAAVAAGAWWYTTPRAEEAGGVLGALADVHRVRVEGLPAAQRASSGAAAEAWFRAAGLPTSLPQFDDTTLRLTGYRIIDRSGTRVAQLLYANGDRVVSVFVLAGKGDAFGHAEVSDRHGVPIKRHRRGDCGVFCWRRGADVFVMVATGRSPADLQAVWDTAYLG